MPQLEEMIERFDRLVESLEAMAERYEDDAARTREIAGERNPALENQAITMDNVGDELRQILMHA